MNNARLTISQYLDGIASGDRIVLSKAITLAESNLPNDQILSAELIERITDKTGNAIRIGITGAPGVGKSTFIEAFGNTVIEGGKKIAILTIDPSSQITKGSILGDKTRMDSLSKNPRAYIRPTASGSVLGGTANKTREAMLLCEAAGFDVIVIETVGVGQSEVAVRNMVDFFLLLMLAGGGDELQGIKKGIVEMADAIAITKADGENISAATKAQTDFQHALHMLPGKISGWTPVVTTCSAVTNSGIKELWKLILKYKDQTISSGFFERQRSAQKAQWFTEYFQQLLLNEFRMNAQMETRLRELSASVEEENVSPYAAAKKMLQEYYNSIRKG